MDHEDIKGLTDQMLKGTNPNAVSIASFHIVISQMIEDAKYQPIEVRMSSHAFLDRAVEVLITTMGISWPEMISAGIAVKQAGHSLGELARMDQIDTAIEHGYDPVI